ncbi:hypothetical protein PsorP6_000138 [Peronosclerospora sorghi]|uniref:Uncharacterized protein n=1 Tax=Peronosclerospora sorghi TaxID=230839 RepID=A0ACC0WTM7_9STRA|nr:hypothetical protein PsorP6_000138 [Peronosclerospora sorghi]
MSKREYFLQKGLQIQRLDEQISSVSTVGIASSEMTKYRELCPPGTSDIQIQKIIAQCKSDAQRMENAISELWEDYRGHGQDDAWATVSKKNTKKKYEHSFQRSYSSQKGQQQLNDIAHALQVGDAQPPRSSDRLPTRGRGSMRGRGIVSSRGGRGGRGGRSRGNAVVRSGITRANQSGGNEEDNPENDENCTDGTNAVNGIRVQQSSKAVNDSKRDRQAKTAARTTTSQPAVQAPPVVYPVLTGAWTKKLIVTATTTAPSKPVEPALSFASAPASADALKITDKTLPVDTIAEVDAATTAPEAPKSVSPTKVQQEKKYKRVQKCSTIETVEENIVEKTEVVQILEKTVSPQASPREIGMKTTPAVEETVETSKISLATEWGTLDVSTSSMKDWSSSAPIDTSESKKTSTSSAWTRGSSVLSPPANKDVAPAPNSPVDDARSTVVPGSPTDIDVPHSSRSVSTSPRPYLKMGKWDSAATPNLSLQFGSFSLSGMESLEPTSPRGWSSSTTTTTTSCSNSNIENVTISTSTQNAWGTTTTSPKQSVSPDHKEQPRVQDVVVVKPTATAPPGLSGDSGRMTPTTEQSPRYTPSAPSPASLPKPDEVKRSTPTRAHGGSFQAQGAAAAQSNKMNIGYGTGLYQASYGQYSIDLGRSTTSSTPSQLPSGSGTPKSTGTRGASAQVAAHSPSRGQQSVGQMQQIPLQQQAQQQQQQHVQQQTQQKQVQQQVQQQPQQPQQHQSQQQTSSQLHQQAQAGMQQGYHYAPPPPPGMALAYNPYNYGGYYQGYGYYQNPQFTQYSPRSQYPPRGSLPYGVEGPVPGFSNPPNIPYQDQHMIAQQHEYAGVPQGFGEISSAYMPQVPMQQQGGHHGHQNGPQSHGKSGSASAVGGAGLQNPHGQRGNAGMQVYQNVGGRDHTSPPVPNASAAMTGSYGQHYGWMGNYGAQPVGGWGHMMPQSYQSPSQQQHQVSQQQQQQPNSHQQNYHQYGNGGVQTGNMSNEVNPQARWSSS